MRNSEIPGPLIFTSLFLILLCGFSLPLTALDLTLNGRNHTILSPEALEAHAVNSRIPLQTLYPWMESIEYLEVSSGENRVFWDASRLGEESWTGAFIAMDNGVWKVHVGPDVFSAPDRISLRGTPLEVSSITIWSSIKSNSKLKSILLSALALRNVRVDWREVSNPVNLLSHSPPGNLPHLILLDQLDFIRLSSLLTSSRPITSRISRWLVNSGSDGTERQDFPFPMAIDAYSPEAALTLLLSGDAKLSRIFNWALSARSTGRIIVTDSPLKALENGEASSALLLPSSEESPEDKLFNEIDPPRGTVNIISRQYAAVPLEITSTADRAVADLLIADAARFIDIHGNGILIPADTPTLRFYEAYIRIGRLALSGQMNGTEAAGLISQYIINEEPSGE